LDVGYIVETGSTDVGSSKRNRIKLRYRSDTPGLAYLPYDVSQSGLCSFMGKFESD
jgi:hypothetical protein